jgi:predicted HAD superfamily phosphohydrolase YqeG
MMTDIVCANRLKIKCILTDPLSKEEALVTFFNRKLDNFYRKKYKLGSVTKIDRGVNR